MGALKEDGYEAPSSRREVRGARHEENLRRGILSRMTRAQVSWPHSTPPLDSCLCIGFAPRVSCRERGASIPVPRTSHLAPRTSRTNARAGFTLLELLVVIVIMGIAAGVVTLSVAPSADRLLNDEGNRMVALFRLAQEEARAQGRPIAWEADVQGYRFLTEDKVRDGADDPLRPRAWPVGVSGIQAPQIVFGAEPLLPPARIRIDTEAGTRIFEMDAFGTLIVKR